MNEVQRETHLVLGASGSSGYWVIEALKGKKKRIVAVSRTRNYEGIETRSADMLLPDQVELALAGATHVYICIGVPYSTKMWNAQWPVIMKNVIHGCEKIGARVIFLDNIYMYGPAPLPLNFSEETSQYPIAKKGRVRKAISDMLLEAHREGRVKAVLGRSADFYGPKTANTPLYTSFLENMLKGKSPGWLGSPGKKHTYSYTPDNGRALVELALDNDSYGQAWHLPVSKVTTIEEITSIINAKLGSNFTVSFLPKGMKRVLAWFIPLLREINDVGYMFEQDYVMDAGKFRTRYPHFEVTDLDHGIEAMIRDFTSSDSYGR